jgi:peptide deformylase
MMALRNLLFEGDAALRKQCRPVTDFNPRLHQLLDDMRDTLDEANGVGLAASQVGVLRRVVLVIETNVDEDEQEYVIELINPEIIDEDGEQTGAEGCLSFPGKYGVVSRPDRVRVRAQDRNGEFFEAEGTGMTARCFCHEIDHLNGIVFIDHVQRMLTPEELEGGFIEDEDEAELEAAELEEAEL